jgi:hypothetical protein
MHEFTSQRSIRVRAIAMQSALHRAGQNYPFAEALIRGLQPNGTKPVLYNVQANSDKGRDLPLN